MQATNLESVFENYIKSSNAPYAVLVDGAWGSGKTFFWKNKMKGIAEAHGKKAIYISLNGIREIGVLEQQLFVRIIPYVNNQENPAVKKATDLVSKTIKFLDTSFLKGGLNELFKGIGLDAFNFSDYVICFDDLERCQIDTKETLGFINNFVEHKSLKAVILCDEKKIPDPAKYNEIKEKVIGRVWTFEPNIAETLPIIIDSYKANNLPFFELLQKNTQYILEIISDYDIKNLRIIAFCLSILEGLFKELKSAKEQYVLESIFFSIIISNEFKKGKLSSVNLLNPLNLDDLETFMFSKMVTESMNKKKGEEPPARQYADDFYELYVSNGKRKYVYSPAIFEYVLTGFLSDTAFAEEIKGREPVELPPKISAYRAIINYKFRELENDEFNRLAGEVLRHTAAGDYVIYDYPSIAASFYYFSESKIITETISQLEKIILDGLKISGQRKELNESMLTNLLHFGDTNPKVTEIKVAVKKLHDDLKNEKLKKETVDFIKILEKQDEFELAKCFDEYKFSKELFPHIDIPALLNSLVDTSNKQLFNFTQLLEERYRISNIGEFLYEDRTPLITLNIQLKAFLQTATLDQPRKFLFETLVKTIEDVCEHLEKTKK